MRRTGEDRDLHHQIVLAHERSLIGVLIHYQKLNAVASPVFNPWEAIGPLLAPVVVSLIVLIFGGIIAGTIALLFTMLIYAVLLRPWSQRKIHDRASQAICHSLSNFEILWHFGGFALYLTDHPTTMVEAPHGDWRAFVRRNLPKVSPEDDGVAPIRATLAREGVPMGTPRSETPRSETHHPKTPHSPTPSTEHPESSAKK